MIRLVMENAGLTFWPLFSFVLFLVSSTLIVIWLYRPGSKAFYSDLALLAVTEDNHPSGKNIGRDKNGNAR